MKAIILARVSTEEQREAGNSLPAQQRRLIAYVESGYSKASKSKLTLDKEFVFDESAHKEHRAEFEKVIKYVESFKETVALCSDKVDRLSRDFLVGLPELERLRRAGKVELHFPSDNLVLHRDSPSTDLFHFNIAVSLAQYYSDAISDNTKRAFEQKRKNGEITGNAPIGYKSVVMDEKKRTRSDIVPNPENAHIVQYLFKAYASGQHSVTTLWNEALRLGLKTKHNMPIARSVIDYMLRNDFYIGIAYSKKYDLKYPHNYECIITRELFEQCKKVREVRKKNHVKTDVKPYIFRGLLKCKHCGCSMSPETSKGLIYYSCTNAKHICKRVYVREEALLKPIQDVFKQFANIPMEVQERLVKELRKLNEGQVVFHKREISRIQTSYQKAQDRIERLLDLRLDQSITKDDYDKKLQQLKDEQYQLNIQLDEYTKADHEYHIHVNTVLNLSRRIGEIFESSELEEKRAILSFILQNPVVVDKKLEFSMLKPFDTVLELASCPIVLRWVKDVRTCVG